MELSDLYVIIFIMVIMAIKISLFYLFKSKDNK
jgi:hypothetical protein